MIRMFGRIESTDDGFSQLITLHNLIPSCPDKVCEIDLTAVSWFDANMCASLGAILYPFPKDGWKIKILGMKPAIEGILQRNGFLKNFGFNRPKISDLNRTTIEYQKFDRTDSSAFTQYVERHFVGKGIPQMTKALKKEFRKSISEIFGNSIEHSQTEHGIFACGQFYPRYNRLDFSIADLGVGIMNNVNKKTGQSLNATQSIEWAMSGSNTTKSDISGGFGLKLIKDFIMHNGGKIQIVSNNGFYQYHKDSVRTKLFKEPFPGTVVNIEINTADKNKYCLTSEVVDPNKVF
ncbi:MAG: hypothetical protein WCX65_15475 [bacterium]